jgi:hypothetical protein
MVEFRHDSEVVRHRLEAIAAAANLVMRHAAVAVVMMEYYWKLYHESRARRSPQRRWTW